MKEISVIIPCYNVENYIDDCVESLVNQTFGIERMELIFVNDASTDHTLEKLAAWEQKYPDSIIIITLLENSRQGTARNVGMQYATGEYIGFIDSDDYVELTMYQKMFEFHQRQDVDWNICARVNENLDGTQTITGPVRDGILDVTNQRLRGVMINREATGGIVQRLYKRTWLMSLDVWFPERITYEDNFFGSIVNYYTERVGLIKEPLYHYRINASSTIQKRNSVHHLDRLKIELMKLEELMKRGLYESFRESIEFEFIHLYFVNSIITLINRFDEIPEGIVLEMQQTIKTLFPNWKRNLMLQYYDQIERISRIIDYPFLKGNKREVVEAYKYVMSEEK